MMIAVYLIFAGFLVLVIGGTVYLITDKDTTITLAIFYIFIVLAGISVVLDLKNTDAIENPVLQNRVETFESGRLA